jgi:hypothetical protein
LKEDLSSQCPGKQAGEAILVSDKVDFKAKLVTRDKQGHFILIKGVIHQEEVTTINLFVPSVGAPNFINHVLPDLKTQIDPNTVGCETSIPIYHHWYIIQTKKSTRKP